MSPPVLSPSSRAPLPFATNLALVAAVLLVQATALFAAPFLPRTARVALTLLVVLAPVQWGLIHEGIHGLLVPGRDANRLLARMLAVPLGYSFDLVRFGHLMHHAETGHALDRPDRAGDKMWLGAVRHYVHLLGGHYVMSALIAWAAFVPWRVLGPRLQRALKAAPTVRDAASRWFGNARRRAAIRTDVVLAFALPALSAYLYGASWPWLLLAFYGRGVVLSVMDNMPHYGTDGRDLTQVPAFRLPRWLGGLVMNHHLHLVHHLRPTLPWRALPAAFVQTGRGYDESYVRGVLRQFRGPSRV